MNAPRPVLQASIHQLRERYRAIKRIDLRNAEVDLLKEKMSSFLKGSQRVSACLRVGYDFYRARVFNDDSRPRSISEISYPDPRFVKNFGRANRPGNVLFYASTSYSATVFEVKPLVGQHVSIAKWTSRDEMRFNHVGHSDRIFKRLSSSRNVATSAFARMIPDGTAPSQRYVHEMLAREFARDVGPGQEHEYKISIAISEILLNDIMMPVGDQIFQRMAAIMYPSLGSRGNSENVAIRPWFVDASLDFKEVQFVKIDSALGDEGFNTSIVDFANSLGTQGEIEWKGRPQQWSAPNGETMTFKDEAGQWVARDERGRIVEAH